MDHLDSTALRRRTTGVRKGLVVAAVTALALVQGCGSETEGGGEPEATASTVTVHWVDGDGKLRPVEVDVPGAADMRPQGRAMAAVDKLIHTQPEEDDLSSHWGGRCAVGAKLDSLSTEGNAVVLRVRGAAGVMCKRSGAKLEQQRQQLAWTVVENLEVDASTPVRLFGSNGAVMWEDVVADEGILAE